MNWELRRTKIQRNVSIGFNVFFSLGILAVLYIYISNIYITNDLRDDKNELDDKLRQAYIIGNQTEEELNDRVVSDF